MAYVPNHHEVAIRLMPSTRKQRCSRRSAASLRRAAMSVHTHGQQYVRILAEGLPRGGEVESSSQFLRSALSKTWIEGNYVHFVAALKIAEGQARSTIQIQEPPLLFSTYIRVRFRIGYLIKPNESSLRGLHMRLQESRQTRASEADGSGNRLPSYFVSVSTRCE
jgi:hypothetical protein